MGGMSKPTEAELESPRFQFAKTDSLSKPERIAILSIVLCGAVLDFIVFLSTPGADPARTAISIATTLTFALFIYSPVIATIALGTTVAASFVVGNGIAGIFAGAIASAPVFRLATMPVIVGYIGGLLVANVLIAAGLGGMEPTPLNLALVLIIAAVAGGLGFGLRTLYTRGNRLQHEVRESAEREREAILAERRWIAGELHDSIAHYLTIVALHVQLLDDEDLRPDSQEAIRIAARKALSDLRFVIELAEDSPRGDGVPSGDLAEAIAEARAEFEAAGHSTNCSGDPSDERIPRGVEIILARIVRESATNILKYAGPGEVRIELTVAPESIGLEIRSPLPDVPRRDLPSTGTGLNRMAERVLGVSGSFDAGPADDAWLVTVTLPTV